MHLPVSPRGCHNGSQYVVDCRSPGKGHQTVCSRALLCHALHTASISMHGCCAKMFVLTIPDKSAACSGCFPFWYWHMHLQRSARKRTTHRRISQGLGMVPSRPSVGALERIIDIWCLPEHMETVLPWVWAVAQRSRRRSSAETPRGSQHLMQLGCGWAGARRVCQTRQLPSAYVLHSACKLPMYGACIPLVQTPTAGMVWLLTPEETDGNLPTGSCPRVESLYSI